MDKNGTTYTATPKNDTKDRIEVEIGDSKQAQFYPQTKIMRWDNEVNLSIRHVGHGETSPTVRHSENQVTWDGAKRKIDLYELPISDQHPDGATEIEITLKEKPTSNVMEFSLNTKGVVFHFQPPLSEEEESRGAVRAEHIVGSYAVYASEDKVNRVGGKLYRAGKVGHIPRPRIEDADGNVIWGDLSIEGDLLTVTIPQEFLDKAVYPVRHAAGLTFGYTGVGGTGHANGFSDVAYFRTATPASGGTVQTISVYSKQDSGSSNFKGGIWKASDNTLVANSVTAAKSVNSSTAQWWTTSAYSPEPTITAISYHVGYIPESDNLYTYYDSETGGGGVRDTSYATPGDLGMLFGQNTRYSVYATYTEVASGHPTRKRMGGVLFAYGGYQPGDGRMGW